MGEHDHIREKALRTYTNLQRRRELKRRGPSDSDLVYETRKWDRFLYDEYRESSTTIREVEADGIDRNDRYPDFVREVFTRLYRPGVQRMDPAADGAQWAEKLHATAETLPEFERLINRTKGDQMYSGMGASAICEKIAKEMKPTESNVDIEAMKKRLKTLEQMRDQVQDSGKPNPFQQRVEAAQQELAQAEKEAEALAAGLDEGKIRSAFRRGCAQADKEITLAQQALDSFSYGETPGVPSSRNDWQQKREIADKVGQHKKLQQLAVLAGRMRRIAAQKRRDKVDHAVDEVCNIESGADLGRLLPTELLQLCDEDTEALAFSRFTDRAMLQYKLQGTETKGKGAIIICQDESGSMEGDRDLWAKAVSLALLDLCVRDRRPWGFVHFDQEVTRTDLIRETDHRNPSHVAKVLMDSMLHFTGRMTAFPPALLAAHRMRVGIADVQKADIIIVTDGCSTVTDEFAAEWKQAIADYPCELTVVLIGSRHVGDLQKVADRVFILSDILDSQCGDFYDHMFTV